MKRNLTFWTGAITGSLIIAGCATTKPAQQLQATTPPPHVAPLARDDSHSSDLPGNLSDSIQPATHQTVATVETGAAEARSAAFTPNIGPSNAVVAVAAPVVVQAAEPDAAPDSPELVATGAPVPINLPTALAMIGGQHPVVGFAQ